MLSQGSCEISSLMSYCWGIHPVENWKNQLSLCFLPTLHDLHEFMKTPSGRYIIFCEYNDRNSWLFTCFDKSLRNFFFFKKTFIYEGVDSFSAKSFVEMCCEIFANIYTSELKKYIILPSMLEYWWWGISPTISHGSSCSSRFRFRLNDAWEIFNWIQTLWPQSKLRNWQGRYG